MPTYKTDAIVLSKRSLKEADRLYVLYTKDYGKVEAKVRSAGSTRSKLAGQLEPIVKTRVMIAKGKGFDTIAGAKMLKPFIFSNEKQQAFASLASELIIKFIKPGVADVRIYDLLLAYFLVLEQGQTNLTESKILTLRFIWQFLSMLGYQLDVNDRKFSLFPQLSENSKKLLESCLQKKSQLTILKTSTTVVKELAIFTQSFLRYFSESDIKSYKYCIYPTPLADLNSNFVGNKNIY